MLQNKFKILLIEDDVDVAISLQDALEREGFSTSWKSTGKEGIDHILNHRPHLIILDIRLPDCSGFDLCSQIRQKELFQPILMLTVQSDEIDKVMGLELGADDYMTKPYRLRELLSRIRAMLRRAYGSFNQEGKNQISVGDLLIDTHSGQVYCQNHLVSLTPNEYRILIYLASHPGQVLSRAQIFESVWSYSPDTDSDHTVTVNIRRLREKIEIDPSRPQLLLTVPGIGYRLQP
jgi:DNA-binding response OmpR family regulator